MARRRKKVSTSQRIASLATIGMPQPLRTVFGTRMGSFLLVLLLPALLITGVLTVEWEGGRPRFRFHRERAQEIRKEIHDEIGQEVADKLPQLKEKLSSGQSPSLGDQLPFGGASRLGERPQSEPQWHLSLPPVPNTSAGTTFQGAPSGNTQLAPPPRPLARIRGAFDATPR